MVGLAGAAKLSVDNATKYYGRPITAESDPDLYRNLVANANEGKAIMGADGKEHWNFNHLSSPGTSASFLSGAEAAKPKKRIEGGSAAHIEALKAGALGDFYVDPKGNNNPAGSPWNDFLGDDDYDLAVQAGGGSVSAGGGLAGAAGARRDDSVVGALNRLWNPDNPLMRQAETTGLQLANRRGLLNSSMAAGAIADAAYAAAVPIASQEAGQAHSENLANMEIGARERMLKAELDSRWQMQQAELGSRAAISASDIAARERMFGSELTWRGAQSDLDRQLQEKIASWNLASTDRNAAKELLSHGESLYQNTFINIMNNTALDATQRTAQLESAKNLRDKYLNWVEQMFDIDLEW